MIKKQFKTKYIAKNGAWTKGGVLIFQWLQT